MPRGDGYASPGPCPAGEGADLSSGGVWPTQKYKNLAN
jgi:hypothetical protein